MFNNEKATEFYKRVTKYLESAICLSCESSNLSSLQAYDHDGGFKIPGIAQKQWLYVICLECKYETALWKIIRNAKMQQINNEFRVNSKPMDPFPSRENPDPLGTLTLKKRNKKIETEDISNPTLDEFLDGEGARVIFCPECRNEFETKYQYDVGYVECPVCQNLVDIELENEID